MLPLLLATTGLQALMGGIQSATSGAGSAQKELERQARNSPLYKGSKSIDDYYQQALNRFQESPYQSQQYQIGAKNIQRATAQGLSSLQDRRGGIGGVSRLAGIQGDAFGNLGMQAEAQRNQRFGQLGGATQMKSGEEYKKFDINEMTPYNRRLQLKQMEAQAANERYNAGMQMVGGAVGNAANIASSYAYANPKLPKVSNVATANLSSYASGANPAAAYTNYMNPKSMTGSYTAPKTYNPFAIKLK